MAGRPSGTRRLDVWMNGQLVGQWRIAATGVQQFAYDANWHDSSAARPLSLSLPLSLGTKTISGHAVVGYFDNLLPDSTTIRTRIASRRGAASDEAFEEYALPDAGHPASALDGGRQAQYDGRRLRSRDRRHPGQDTRRRGGRRRPAAAGLSGDRVTQGC